MKLIVFNTQVISTCELINRNIKKIIFPSETNDVNQNVLQMFLKMAPANFFSSPYLIQRFRHFLKMLFQIQTGILWPAIDQIVKTICQNLS